MNRLPEYDESLLDAVLALALVIAAVLEIFGCVVLFR